MGQKMCFSDNYVIFRVRRKILIISTIFRKITQNSLLPQCKTSIDNNSGSIKDRVVKFSYSRGFSEFADRMVWPPSLSPDRKWPRKPIRCKTTRWMRLTPLPYKPEQSVMRQKMCFGDRYVIFGVRTKKINNFHYFSQKKREIPWCSNVKLQSAIIPNL